MKNKKILGFILFSLLVSISGCGKSTAEENAVMDGVTAKRLNVEGVDCVIARGRYADSVSVSCDWNNSKFTK
tara:strand:- start:5048 stop:5263 length:216 start_codon:yes stop_codon:yes gene_type:complete